MKATLLSSLVLMLAAWLISPCCYGQDFESQVRQRQEEVRRRIEEGRARMQRHREEMERSYSSFHGAPSSLPSDYASRSRNTYLHEYTAPASPSASLPTAGRAVQTPGTYQARAQHPARTPHSQQKSVQKATTRSTLPKASKTAAAPAATTAKARKARAVAPASGLSPMVRMRSGKNLDQMPEIALPAEESINWKGFWKGAIIGGIAGGIVGALAWVIGQLVRGAGPDTKSSRPNDGGSRLAVAGVAAATIAVTLNFGQHYDQLDPSKLPLLRNIFPPEPKVSTVRQFQPVYSQVFQFSLSIPQPFGLEHKEIAKLWTTILTHKEKDGAFMMAFATMPQPVQQAQPVSSGLPFSPVPTAYPPRVSFDVERALDSSAQTSVDFIQGIVTHKAPITQNGLYPGREVEGTLPSHDGVFRERIYIANGNFYQLVVVGIPAWTNSDDAKKFLDSFKIGP